MLNKVRLLCRGVLLLKSCEKVGLLSNGHHPMTKEEVVGLLNGLRLPQSPPLPKEVGPLNGLPLLKEGRQPRQRPTPPLARKKSLFMKAIF